ncbi:MAG: transposase [Deltaproteobacteria bacterium]|nr:MAG: transposase [Deltaproteobacteria bacterium]
MELPSIFSATLGLSPPWQVTAVTFAKDGKRLDITVSFETGGTCRCPRCGAAGRPCYAATNDETWFHRDFFRYATYLHTRVPQISCCCGRHPVDRPWARSGSMFVKINAECQATGDEQ